APTSAAGQEGKIAQRFRKASGVPDQAEMSAIQERGKAFKKALATASMTVFPVHTGDSYSPESATAISSGLGQKKLAKVTAADKGPRLEIARDMNEQKVLWSMAHAFSEHVKKNPPTSDYVLFADYLLDKNAVAGVHFAICNKQGDLVVVD